ncbi:transposase [Agrobacterium larrymoorei]|uniref:transposase n=1 Tax=Agrobacterium larrymoorei TaxID=160699 RepID=UPI0040387201
MSCWRAECKVAAGQAANTPIAEKLPSKLQPGETILADRTYDTDAILDFAKRRECWANISESPIEGKQSASAGVSRQRNLVERFFNRIKQIRSLTTRYDQHGDNYLAALKLVATRI